MSTEEPNTPRDRLIAEAAIKNAFTPATPITRLEVFRGRIQQIREAADVITTPGQHCILYGERGVGKTSLANVLTEMLEGIVGTARVNCAATDTFTSVIRRCLEQVQFSQTRQGPGFLPHTTSSIAQLADRLPDSGPVSPDAAALLLTQLPPIVVLVVDEFDRLRPRETEAFADMIKALSDRAATTTLVLVGVAEDVTSLVGHHQSVARCLRQIRLPRMSDQDIGEIIDKGMESAGFTINTNGARSLILGTAQGFPHYAHLLGLNSSRAALDGGREHVTELDVRTGMDRGVQSADATLRDGYHKAVTGTRKANRWKEVVAACARAGVDERGYFPTREVQDQLSAITGEEVIQQAVAYHLGKLIEVDRGPLLERTGPIRRYRYRFRDPLMRPFVMMESISRGILR